MNQHKILIVDDDRSARDVMALRLNGEGYELLFAQDGVAAVAVARRDRPDLVLLDLGIPAGDGMTVLERLRDLATLAGLPIIIVSARNSSEWKSRVLQAGAVAYLQKPVESGLLLQTVSEFLPVLQSGAGAREIECPSCQHVFTP